MGEPLEVHLGLQIEFSVATLFAINVACLDEPIGVALTLRVEFKK